MISQFEEGLIYKKILYINNSKYFRYYYLNYCYDYDYVYYYALNSNYLNLIFLLLSFIAFLIVIRFVTLFIFIRIILLLYSMLKYAYDLDLLYSILVWNISPYL